MVMHLTLIVAVRHLTYCKTLIDNIELMKNAVIQFSIFQALAKTTCKKVKLRKYRAPNKNKNGKSLIKTPNE